MAVLSEDTKIAKVDAAFGTLVKEFIDAGEMKAAQRVLSAAEGLGPVSKVRLFDILTKT